MQKSSRLQISDLESNQPDIVQEITPEEAEKIVGGKNNKKDSPPDYPEPVRFCPPDYPEPVKFPSQSKS